MSLNHTTVMSVRQPDATADTVRTETHRKATVPYRVLAVPIVELKSISWNGKGIMMVLEGFGLYGKPCFPSNARIAKAAGMSEATVKRTLPELAKEGFIAIVKSGPGSPRLRQIIRLWMDDPALHPHHPNRSATQGQSDLESGSDCTGVRVNLTSSQGQSDPLENYSRESLERTTKNGSSSSVSSAQAKAADPEQDTEPEDDGGFGDYQLKLTVKLAVDLWPGELPETMEAQAKALCDKNGTRNVLAALRDVEKRGKQVEWPYFLGIVANKAKEAGGVSTASRPKPKPATPRPVPDSTAIRTRATIAEGRAEKWKRTLAAYPQDLRDAIEAAPTGVRKEMEDDVDRSNSPAFLEPPFRVKLKLPVPPEMAIVKPPRPAPGWVEPAGEPMECPAFMCETA